MLSRRRFPRLRQAALPLAVLLLTALPCLPPVLFLHLPAAAAVPLAALPVLAALLSILLRRAGRRSLSELNAALSDLRTQRRREKAQYQGAPFADVFQVELILSEEDSDRACIVDVGDTGRSYVIPWSSIPQELQQPLRRYVAQADGKLCGYCKEDLCNTENGRMIVELYLGKQEHHVSRILY